MNQHSCSHTLLPLRQSPPLPPPPSWISECAPAHYSWAGIAVVMCADTEEEKGGSVSVSQSHNSSMRVCACGVWVCQIEGAGEDREDRHWLMLPLVPLPKLLPRCSHLNPHLWDSAGALCSFRAGAVHDAQCVNGMPEKRCPLRSDWWEPALRCGGWPPVSVPLLLGENWTPGVSTTTIMGCNLCTLQKREEHYKLLYEIAQVSRGTADSGIDSVCCRVWFIMRALRRKHFCCCCLFLKSVPKPRGALLGVFQGEDWKGLHEGLID